MRVNSIVAHFHAWNFLALSLVCLLLRGYNTSVPFLQWPVNSILSILMLSALTFYLRDQVNTALRLIMAGIIFTTAHWFLAGFLEVLLTRFFRLPEIYSFRSFDDYLKDHLTLILDGLLWFGCYMLLFSWMRVQVKMNHLAEANQSLEKELGQVDLKALNQEMSPHFLFNAMNGISMKIRMKQNAEAVNMLAALTDLLRLNLSKQKDLQITLAEEIELLNKYLLIEKSRFGDHFSVEIDVGESLLTWKVPRLILQPLVENAFKHGMSRHQGSMVIKIEGALEEEQLCLSVYNSHLDQSRINFAKSNIGLPNIVHRLRIHYGANFQFQSLSSKDGVMFRIKFPGKT